MKLLLRGVGKRFGAVEALTPIDLEVEDGEFISILGPSGCGKSTLVRLVAGLLPTSSGVLEADGRAITKPLPKLGIVFQQPVLLDWLSALDNVLFQIEMRGEQPRRWRERALALLEQVGLQDFAGAYPYALSGGMRQRVALARALVHEPELLLMDEPFGALDALTREQMRIDLEALWLRQRMTTLFVTHSVDEAVLLADRVVVMSPRPGRIDRVLSIDIARPRGLAARRDLGFLRAEEEITGLFLERGVLTRGPA